MKYSPSYPVFYSILERKILFTNDYEEMEILLGVYYFTINSLFKIMGTIGNGIAIKSPGRRGLCVCIQYMKSTCDTQKQK